MSNQKKRKEEKNFTVILKINKKRVLVKILINIE